MAQPCGPSQYFEESVLDLLHEENPDINNMKILGCEIVWWPDIDKDVEESQEIHHLGQGPAFGSRRTAATLDVPTAGNAWTSRNRMARPFCSWLIDTQRGWKSS